MQPRSISNHIRLEAERIERSVMAGAKEKEKPSNALSGVGT